MILPDGPKPERIIACFPGALKFGTAIFCRLQARDNYGEKAVLCKALYTNTTGTDSTVSGPGALYLNATEEPDDTHPQDMRSKRTTYIAGIYNNALSALIVVVATKGQLSLIVMLFERFQGD